MIKIKNKFLFIFCIFFVKINLTNYISLEFHIVDDCIRSIIILDQYIFKFEPPTLEDCDYQYQNIYPQFFIKNYQYEFRTDIHFYFQDSWHLDGFMNITVRFNEYIIRIYDKRFWHCENCGGDGGEYVLDQERINFYRGKGDGNIEEKLYHFTFNVDNIGKLYDGGERGNFEVDKNYYLFTTQETFHRRIYYLDRELDLINFNDRNIFYINGNETLPIDLSMYFFHIDYLNKNDFNGSLTALGLNNDDLKLGDNYDFAMRSASSGNHNPGS